MTLEIEVFGEPAPQGSKKIMRGRLIEASKKLGPWRAAIAKAVDEILPPDHNIILGPVEVELDFFLTRPQTVKLTKRPLPITPPDVDKLCRAALDGLGQGLDGKSGNGRLWADDSLCVKLTARKYFADDREPGAVIKITVL